MTVEGVIMKIAIKPISFIHYDLSKLCFLIFFLLKPFYLLPSGSIQIGDMFLVLSFAFHIYNKRFNIVIIDKTFVYFLLCVFAINGAYFLKFQNEEFLKSCLYYLFNFMVIICFRNFLKDPDFLKKLEIVCKINIIVQIILFITGIGEYWFGTVRYIGTYNDPNQLGFAIISTFFIIYILNAKHLLIYFALSVFLIFQTYSTGMLLAITVLVAFYIITNINISKIKIKPITLVVALVIIVTVMFIVYRHGFININWDRFRVDSKLNKGDNAISSFLKDRNMEIITKYPEYFIYGFGEGYTNRFYGYGGELHSTVISLWYYYGIIPYTFIVKWVVDNVKKMSFHIAPTIIALLIEAVTLVNHRQPAFWMIIILASFNISKRSHKDEIQHNSAYLQYRKVSE